MAKSYEQIQAQITALQKKAEELRRKEAAGVVKQIKEAIAYYGLTAADLGLDGKPSTRQVSPPKASSKKAKPTGKTTKKRASKPAAPSKGSTIKYRDDAGNTWSGRGPRPGWFKEALAQGRSPEELMA